MPGLRSRWRRRRTERGAVAVLVTVLFGSGVLLGMGALVVDAGGMYAEKAQLQNGADTGAMGVALGCAKGAATCNTAGRAEDLADSNANDQHAKVDNICGRDPYGRLSACAASTPGCAPAPSAGATYAQVQTSTETATGGTLLPPAFGRALLGQGYQGARVHACAQAVWASAGSANTLSATVSLCAWNQGTANGTVFGPQPPYPPWPAGYTGTPPAAGTPGGEQVLMLHGSGNDCAGGAAGWQLPGGFGWLDDPTSTCSVFVDVSGQYADRTGVPVTADCITRLDSAITNHSTLYFPVYDGVSGTGGNGSYHLKGIAAFVPTGGYLNGSGGWKRKSLITGNAYCNGAQRCIYGFFTRALLPPGSIPGGADLGTSVVQQVG
jgi:hypothetical protein